MADFYVWPDEYGTSPTKGSPSNTVVKDPLNQLLRNHPTITAGDRVFMAPGVYLESRTFWVAGNHAAEFANDSTFVVSGSTGNDGTYTCNGNASYIGSLDMTRIRVDEDQPQKEVVDGTLGASNYPIVAMGEGGQLQMGSGGGLTKGFKIYGPNAGIDPNTGTRGAEAIIPNRLIRMDGSRAMDYRGFLVDGVKFANPGGIWGPQDRCGVEAPVPIGPSAPDNIQSDLTVLNTIIERPGQNLPGWAAVFQGFGSTTGRQQCDFVELKNVLVDGGDEAVKLVFGISGGTVLRMDNVHAENTTTGLCNLSAPAAGSYCRNSVFENISSYALAPYGGHFEIDNCTFSEIFYPVYAGNMWDGSAPSMPQLTVTNSTFNQAVADLPANYPRIWGINIDGLTIEGNEFNFTGPFAGDSATWLPEVLEFLDLTTMEPAAPTTGDRYVNTVSGTSNVTTTSVTANNIYEWNGSAWDETVPSTGEAVEAGGQGFLYSGSSWDDIATAAHAIRVQHWDAYADPTQVLDATITGNAMTADAKGTAEQGTSFLYIQPHKLDASSEVVANLNRIDGAHTAIQVYDTVTEAFGNLPTGFVFDARDNAYVGCDFGVRSGTPGEIIDSRDCYWSERSGPSGGVADPVSGTLADGTGAEVSEQVRFAPFSEGECDQKFAWTGGNATATGRGGWAESRTNCDHWAYTDGTPVRKGRDAWRRG